MRINPVTRLKGEPCLPGDKSISHRAALLGALANGATRATNFLLAEDTLSTLRALGQLGVEWELEGTTLTVRGRGYQGLSEPAEAIDVGNSGTTIRLLSGVVAACPFLTRLTGDSSIRRRPMRRVIDPLTLMGAEVVAAGEGELAPLSIKGGGLHGIDYELPMPSAQVKSAVILAALNAQGETIIRGDQGSRDHTERMGLSFGADLEVTRECITVRPSSLAACELDIPADLSSASFFLAGAVMLPNSEVILRDVGLNPTRAGFLSILNSMGAMVMEDSYSVKENEPRGNLLARGARLRGVEIEGWRVPGLIDEIPLLAVVATQAEGITRVSGAEELRHKESDRLTAIISQLKKMGADIEEEEGGFTVRGRTRLKGARVESCGDHRIAMSLAIAALCAEGDTVIEGWESVGISFPGFAETLRGLAQ
jgi:3-phosphoshikimate 1-carboxyvinyltransferase